jgi:osmotically-inducible protein OsmY
MKAKSFAAFLTGGAAGLAAGYLLDPQSGKRRRHVLRDRAMAEARRSSRQAEKQARYMAGKAQGAAAEAMPIGHHDPQHLNDASLAAKVESELFRPADAPKGSVDVNVEHGTVILRGQLASGEQIDELLARARAIDGVVEVRSLLHLPGETVGAHDGGSF